ncbi:hypothetical protein AB0J86_02655 [Micromonospora sp. NPDC049559]|uniref:hypothetical protein n=1 Tax=Micromonospora sp. NPDC049559 TaxID=3155923 RepID=UPI003416E06D
MPSPTRHRRATVAVAALFAGAPSLASSVATAGPPPDPARDGRPEVVFTGGGLFRVRCGVEPKPTSLRLPPESSLRVVNDTGRSARLLLDGVAQGEIPGGSAGDVLVHRGPVSVALRPDCLLTDEAAVRVEVQAVPVGAVPTGPEAMSSGDLAGAGDRAGGAAPGASSATRPGVAEDAPPLNWARGPAAEPAGQIRPVREGGPVGLLALIAAICVVGVSAGAIRAIIAQRATRAVVA